ncbi:uncharacterized protein LOC129769717 [Toxorhynchites rutilus septentrionalis]|uniref:uncharacterized protein LOC129769717 n=1 Tax=Toxorhynchites rutilus septentrionalis TaxID=329112 RepID=UPI0024788851|nr:uncharacterized protein LOC129769717 [Toxorhynchites rutilus septentrionalis]
MNRTNVSCVKWVDFSDHMYTTYLEVFVNALYADVALVLADGGLLSASRMVLSMASEFFEAIFQAACSTNSMSLVGAQEFKLLIPDVSSGIMKHVLHFIYTGEVHLNARDMSDFFDACQLFRLKGLDYQNGNINGIKISGSNIIPEYEYEELQETYLEETPPKLLEEPIRDAEEPTQFVEAPDEKNIHTMDKHVNVAGAERFSQEYEVEMEMEDLDVSSNGGKQQEIPSLETLVVNSEELFSSNQSNLSDTEANLNESSESTSKKRVKNCEYGNRLEEAINTIIQGGASFRTASIQYGIPKTVLWRKAVKAPNYKAERCELPSPRREAIEALKSGEKMLNISKRFDIPLSTLHRDKIKLYSEGALPENVSLKQRDKGSDFKDRVLEAARHCVAGIMSQSEAAKYFKLPKTTIWRKIKALRAEGRIALDASGSGDDLQTEDLAGTLEDIDETAMCDEEHLDPEYVALV